MSYCAVWLDHQNAFIYTFSAEGVSEKKLEAHHHETNEKFFHEIAETVNGVEELMIMGPGTAKEQFKHHCENHHHKQVAKTIVGVENMQSHPTKAMMMEKANTFFSKHHMWTKNY